jgi:hypothetical protein
VANYLVQEEDGTSRFTLEDGSGFILLEDGVTPPTPTEPHGGGIILTRRKQVLKSTIGRFRSRAVRIIVTAPDPQLTVTLMPVIQAFTVRSAAAPMAVMFTSTAYEATSRYTRRRHPDLDERIRMIIIHDEE